MSSLVPDPAQGPFILLDDARREGAASARLYRAPVEMLEAWDRPSLDALLDRLSMAGREGLHAAGYFAYEAGLALEPALHALLAEREGTRLAWFGLYAEYETIAPDAMGKHMTGLAANDRSAFLGPVETRIDEAAYAERFAAIRSAILAGDIYQANLCFQNEAAFSGDPLALYAALRQSSGAGYGGVMFDGADWLLSLSPELFFTLKQGRIVTRPMKGTVARGDEPVSDRVARNSLSESAKDRAENLMIVDLLRNDLARVSVPGSVSTDKLFSIETYPTVHQMTSTVQADLSPGLDAVDVLRAIFPCGSITGAPKIRAMQILHGVEGVARGPYCGAIGRIDAAHAGRPGDAAFNVAIRTLHFRPQARTIAFGLGSGVVADSSARDEWLECRNKGAFVEQSVRRFDLIETMGFDPEQGIGFLEAHLARMKASAQALRFEFDRHAARNALNAICFHLEAPACVRLLLSPSGAIAIETRPMPETFDRPLRVAVRPLPVCTDDLRLMHKTSDRAFYDQARRDAVRDGADEVIFVREDGQLTEGSFTHIFVERGGRLATPPLECGLLPGILRAALIEDGRAAEQGLAVGDLQNGFQVGNALRGLMPARLIAG